MNYNLIFDVGYHKGESTKKYLQEGYTVIGIECNPKLISYNYKKYSYFIERGKLQLINKAVHDKDDEITDFYICNYNDQWSSCNPEIPYRSNDNVSRIQVYTVTLKTLIKKYGCPYYCKIDIEGNDIIAIKSLINLQEIPKYISAESECTNYNNKDIIDPYSVLDTLHEVGYSKFNIIQQYNGGWDGCNIPIPLENLLFYTYEEIRNKLSELRNNYDFDNKLHFWYWY